MKLEQKSWTESSGWKAVGKGSLKAKAQLVLAFGQRELIANSARYDELRASFPNALILMGSTSGEIIGSQVQEESIVATGIQFEKTTLQTHTVNIGDFANSKEAGIALAKGLPSEGLRHVFIISDGGNVNGTDLIEGVNSALPPNVSVTGGLAGDGAKFQQTLVGLNEVPLEKRIAAIGLYGEALKIGYGSMGGWDPFGPERRITKSEANVLFELDDKPALELYKTYLGDKASELPGSGLLFPLVVKSADGETSTVVRTLLNIDEGNQSMTFAGNMPTGSSAQLMRANFDRLIDGATNAANNSFDKVGTFEPELAILVSCVGRKLVLGQRIEEEVEAVQNVVGKNTKMTGFYSYGELAPDKAGDACLLHNQTMTVTFLSEN